MTSYFALPTAVPSAPTFMLIDAARCRHRARKGGKPVQPCLFALLSHRGLGMLAPVLDGLMTLYEAALGRRMTVGGRGRLSKDEERLVALLARADVRQDRVACTDGAFTRLHCALCSARIMILMVAEDVQPGAAPGCA